MLTRPEIYDTYWKFAHERQEIFWRKIAGVEPLSLDPIFQEYKFCNAYRANDRVTQFLIKDVIYCQDFQPADYILRIILFRLLNRIETWQLLESKVGLVNHENFDPDIYSQALAEIKGQTGLIYGNAFILPPPSSFGFERKHENHLALLKDIISTSKLSSILSAKSLKELFEQLKEIPSIGNFLAYQIAIDLNYSPVFNFSENDFTMPGPGALRGIAKCFTDIEGKSPEYVIMNMVEKQDQEFARLGLNFRNLWGRPLQAIDCQNLFCEVDKYCRVKFPELKSPRVKIKSRYSAKAEPIAYFYPPKWDLKIN